MTRAQPQPPPAPGPEAGDAKPAVPGPTEPPGIAASILPQRQEDAARHPEDQADPHKDRTPGGADDDDDEDQGD